MMPQSLLHRQIIQLTARVQARRIALEHNTALVKMHAWRCATSPAVVTGALAISVLVVWMRWRK